MRTTLQTMMTSINSRKDNKGRLILAAGFTLFELIAVLAIISVAVGITLPYATRSNHILNIRQDALNIAEAFRYGIDLAQDVNHKIKISVNTRDKTYRLLQENDNKQYVPLDGYFGIVRRFNNGITVANVQGMDNQAGQWSLIIDPIKAFQDADMELRSKDIIMKIIIAGRKVAVEETSI